MKSKKGQGLSLNFIVIAALVALVLVIVAAFTIGGFGEFFGRIAGGSQAIVGESLDDVRTACSSFCDQAKQITTTTKWVTTTYCKRTFNIDLNGDGVIEGEEKGMHCWDDAIDSFCRFSITAIPDVPTCTSPASGQLCNVDDCGGTTADSGGGLQAQHGDRIGQPIG